MLESIQNSTNKTIPEKFKSAFNSCEPLVQNRFKVTFDEKLKLSNFITESITLPKYNGYVNKWDAMEIKLCSLVSPSTTVPIYELVQKFMANKTNKGNNISNKIEEDLFNFTIEELDPVGTPINTWNIKSNQIKYVDFGYMDAKITINSPTIISINFLPLSVELFILPIKE